MKVFRIRVPEIWYQTYYVRAEDEDLAKRDFSAGCAEYKVGESELEEILTLDDGWNWDVDPVTCEKELSEIRTLQIHRSR